MIKLKTAEDIEKMGEGGNILKKVIDEAILNITPGVTTGKIDKIVEKLIKKYGATPSFKTVKNYRWATCICINDQVVHTPPSKRIFKKGDIVTVDIGVYYKGLHTDFATTFFLGGKPGREVENFLQTGEKTLAQAIEQAKVGRNIGHVSKKIYDSIAGNGYFIIKELAGHGIGIGLHEDPMIPGFVDGPIHDTAKIKNGMALAIEIIYSMGTKEIMYEKGSAWSLVTVDASPSACFEKTVAILDNQTITLT